MSQSGRLTLNQPVPGAGIQTITGNVGGAVPGDGAANINLVGAGTITVTGAPGTNTLTVTSSAAPATYTTDHGVALPDGAGNVNVVGDALNTTTDALVPNTITVYLNPSVTLSGSLTAAGNIVSTAGNFTATTGNFVAPVGNVNVGGVVHATGGATFHNQVLITANGIETTGPTILNSLNRGVVQVDAAHTLFSDEGTDGQLLIASSTGPAAWRTLTAGSNVNIVNGANSITISADVDIASQFNADVGVATPVANILRVLGGSNINTTGAGNVLTVSLANSVSLTGSLSTGTTITAGTNLTVNGTSNLIGNITGSAGLLIAGNGRIQTNFWVDGTTRLVGNVTTNADVTIGGNLGVAGASVFQGDVNLDAAAALALSGRINGALITDSFGVVSASNGTNGQLLIGGGTRPTWRNLSSADGSITITNGANSIDLSSSPLLAGFSGFLAAAIVNATGNNTVYQLKVNTLTLNDGGVYSVAAGAYTAPRTGNYYITHMLHVYGMQATHSGLSFDIYVNVPVPVASSTIQTLNCNPWDCSNSIPDVLKFTGSIMLYLNAGDKLTFAVIGNGGPKTISIGTNTVLSIWPIS